MSDEDFEIPDFDSDIPKIYSPVNENVKTNLEIAQEVVAGRWGRGNARKKKLTKAGYDPDKIYAEVLKIFNQ